MVRIGKYEFLSKEQAQTKIDALGTAQDENGNEYPTHKHAIVQLGNIVLSQGEYDENGEETVAPILSTDWHVDVLWSDLEAEVDGTYSHPYGWATYSINPSEEGVHSFWGVSFQEYKI